jgi:hypothetical protein
VLVELATKRSAAQLGVLKLEVHALQQLAKLELGIAMRLTKMLLSTPTPSYLSQLVPLHTGCEVTVAVREMVRDTVIVIL